MCADSDETLVDNNFDAHNVARVWFHQKCELAFTFWRWILATCIGLDKTTASFVASVAKMEDNDAWSGDRGWMIGLLVTLLIGCLLLFHISPSVDAILRGGFFLTLCGFLETYLPKRQ